MLIDPQGVDKAQGGVGLVCMLYFSADGKTMQVEYYSTDKQAYFLENSQFTLTLDLAGDKTAETTTAPEATEPETTEAPTVEETEAPAIEVTEAPAQTDAPATDKKGCGATVISPVFIIAIASGYVLSKRRTNDGLASRE